MLSKMYDPSVYAALGPIEHAHKLANENQLKELGSIIIKFGYEDKLAVIIAHRHFDLLRDEAMLEENVDATNSIARPAPMEHIIRANAKPNVLALGPLAVDAEERNVWYPVNYSLEELDDSPWADDAFLAECAKCLATGTCGRPLFMLAARTNRDVHMLETNYDETRESVLSPVLDGVMPANTIETTFKFERTLDADDGKMVPSMACTMTCLSSRVGGHSLSHVVTN